MGVPTTTVEMGPRSGNVNVTNNDRSAALLPAVTAIVAGGLGLGARWMPIVSGWQFRHVNEAGMTVAALIGAIVVLVAGGLLFAMSQGGPTQLGVLAGLAAGAGALLLIWTPVRVLFLKPPVLQVSPYALIVAATLAGGVAASAFRLSMTRANQAGGSTLDPPVAA